MVYGHMLVMSDIQYTIHEAAIQLMGETGRKQMKNPRSTRQEEDDYNYRQAYEDYVQHNDDHIIYVRTYIKVRPTHNRVYRLYQ